MNEAVVQTVLRCGLCNKPFDKESTLKRHGYYCRSRSAGSKPRARSCYACASGRTRCDHKRPECSRCLTKGIQCQYPTKVPKSRESRILLNYNAPTEESPSFVTALAGLENAEEECTDVDALLNSAIMTSDQDFAAFGGLLGWEDLDFNCSGLMNLQSEDKTIQPLSPGSPTFLVQSTPSIDQTLQFQQAIHSHNASIPKSPTHTTRSLILRYRTNTGAPKRIADLILHTLKSYPLMMLRYNTLPPFIHPGLISSNDKNDQMEPLTNCVSLVHMISNGQGSRKLFWKNVRRECEQICGEHTSLSRWELLAAMQALSVYILIRLDEGETEHSDLDFLLLATVAKISMQLVRISNKSEPQSALCRNYGFDMGWKDWLYEESRRRLSVVYRVVSMLVYFEPAALCTLQSDLILAPLPAKKQLWEASNEVLWNVEVARDPGTRNAFALASSGELVKLSEDQQYCSDSLLLYKSLNDGTPKRSMTGWEEWLSGMDGFGGLVMLAASLIA